MNPFFARGDGDFDMPRRVYARAIDADGSRHLLLDAIDADWFDAHESKLREWPFPGPWARRPWVRRLFDTARIFAIEVNSRRRTDPIATSWLRSRPRPLPPWLEIHLESNKEGPAEVYANIAGPPQRATVSLAEALPETRLALLRVTNLSPYYASATTIEASLPATTIDQVFVLDVGQGSANVLLNDMGEVVAYVDLGAGVLADTGTWPSAMTGICLAHDPVVVLTHWHYDHFQAANTYAGAKSLTWIAPAQPIGPGPQLAMATDIVASGKLLVWNGRGSITKGAIELERCTGSASDFNRSGIAVWIAAPSSGNHPILLPGDAGYKDIPNLAAGRNVTSFAVAHHGGQSSGTPPADPGLAVSRAAMSYGGGNSYGHPLARHVSKLVKAGWTLGPFPGASIDDRRSEDRAPPHSTGAGLGHIRLQWPASTLPARACMGCGCSIDPTQ